ncbi:AUGMIN subunit 3 [Ancistrocladus abbreviatus]
MLGAYSLLEVIDSELQCYLSATKGRVGRFLALIQAATDVQGQGAVHDKDTLHGIRDLLSICLNSQAGRYMSAPGIVQQISCLTSDLMAFQSDLENLLHEDRNRCINELPSYLLRELQTGGWYCRWLCKCKNMPLMEEFDEMEKINAKLSAAVEEVTLEH